MQCLIVQRLLLLIILATSLVFLSCASKPKSFANAGTNEDAQNKISHAQKLHEDGEINSAISILETLIAQSKYTRLLDPAYELVIEYLLEIKQISEAKTYAEIFLRDHRDSPSTQKISNLFNNYAVFE